MTRRTTIRRRGRPRGLLLGSLRAAPILVACFSGGCLFANAQLIARPTHPQPQPLPISKPLPLSITELPLPDGFVDFPLATSVTITGGSGLYSVVINGDPPPGVVLIQGPATLSISGVPTTEGDYPLAVGVVDTLNGTTVNHTYNLHVGPRLAHPEASTVNVADSESIHTSDSDAGFFPAKLADSEVFHFADSDLVFMPAVVKFAEGFTFKDTASVAGAPMLKDLETFHFTDTALVRGSAMGADSEVFHLADTVNVTVKNKSILTIISPTVRTGATAYITAYFAYTGATPTGAVTMLVNGSSANISGQTCINKSQHTNCTATYSAVGIPVSNNVLTVSQASDSNYVAVSGTGFVTVTP